MNRSATVYVVDDDEAVRESTVGLIGAMGLSVRDYESAEDFRTDFENDGPACLILDIRMPGMSGIELFDVLMARQIQLPVIFVTGHSEEVTIPGQSNSATTWFLEKPFRPQDLQQRVRWALESQSTSGAESSLRNAS